MNTAVESYCDYDENGIPSTLSLKVAFKKIPGICYIQSLEIERPYMKDLFYIRGILRNTCYKKILPGCIDLLCEAMDSGVSIELLRRLAKNARYYEDYEGDVQLLINQQTQD